MKLKVRREWDKKKSEFDVPNHYGNICSSKESDEPLTFLKRMATTSPFIFRLWNPQSLWI